MTKEIQEAEITPVLEGSCRIQGPVDEPEHQLPGTSSELEQRVLENNSELAQRLPEKNSEPELRLSENNSEPEQALPETNLSMLAAENKCASENEKVHRRSESGTCNTCSAPCSSCRHLNRTDSFTESNVECQFSGKKEDDTCSSIGVERLSCHDNQHAACETSTTSSHDPFSENTESKAIIEAPVCGTSDAADMPSKVPSHAEHGNDLPKKRDVTDGDTISCVSAVRDVNVAATDHNVEVDKKEVACSSGSTSSLLAKGISDKVKVGVTSGSGPSICDKKYSRKRSTGPNPVDLPASEDIHLNVQSLPLNSEKEFQHDGDSNVQPLPLNSEKEFQHNDDSKDLKGNPISQVQVESVGCLMENTKSLSSGDVAADNVNEQVLAAAPNSEDNKLSSKRSDNTSAGLGRTGPCLETETQTDKSNAFLETSSLPGSEVQPKPNVAYENFDPVSGLYDVKVCDICGDAGREELLAVCCRCSDGAEHTYCMRKKLDKLPEGDWLCEECKTKEDIETRKVATYQEVRLGVKVPQSSQTLSTKHGGNLVNSLLPTKKASEASDLSMGTDQESKLGVKALQSSQVSSTRYADNRVNSSGTTEKASEASGRSIGTTSVNLSTKALQSSQALSTRHGDNLVDSSVTTTKASEASGKSMGNTDPRLKASSPHKVSLNNSVAEKLKRINVAGSSVGGQPAKNVLISPSLQTSLSFNSKFNPQLQSPRVPVSRSNSLNSSNWKPSPKLPRSIESTSDKVKVKRDSISVDLGMKEMGKMTKSASFKSESLNRPSIEMVDKIQSLASPPSEVPSGLKQVKARNDIEKKHSVQDQPSPSAGTGILFPKGDMKITHHDVRIKNTSESKILNVSEVSDGNDTGKAEMLVKTQSVISPRSEDPSGLKLGKERNAIEKKYPVLDQPSPLSGTGIVSQKVDPKMVQYEGRQKNTSESKSINRSDVLDGKDAGKLEMVGKTQSLLPPRSEDPSISKLVKERNVIEKKYPVHDQPSPLAGSGVRPPKVDLKIAQHHGRLKNTSESEKLNMSEVSHNGNDAGCKEEKQQLLLKNFQSQSSDGTSDPKSCKVSKDGIRASFAATDRAHGKVDTILPQKAARVAESAVHDNKIMEARDVKTVPSHSNSSKQLVSGANRVVRCQRCNETGHATRFCPIDRLSAVALKPSTERVFKEGIKKSNKWKAAVEATNLKTRLQNNVRLPDHVEGFQPPGLSSRDVVSNSTSCPSNLPCPEGRTNDQEMVSGSEAEPGKVEDIDTRQLPVHTMEDPQVLTTNGTNIIVSNSEESSVKSSIVTFPDQASALPHLLRASAIPELDFIWQGGFEVTKIGGLPELFNGIQAHLSTCASPRIPELVNKFSCKVQLEEVPRSSSWPLQFQGTGPKKVDIALFLFAKDIESYEKYYSKLLGNMMTNDLALRGDIDGGEFLVFSSNTLPANAQCWNSLFFLWGVFRGRATNCLEAVQGSQKKPCQSVLGKYPLASDLDLPEIKGNSFSQKIDAIENQGIGLSRPDRLFDAKKVNQGKNQHPSLVDSGPETKISSSAKVLSGNGDTGVDYMKNPGTSSENEVAEPRALTVKTVSLDRRQEKGADGSRSEEKRKEKDEPMSEINHPSWPSSPSRKRARSFSVEMEITDEAINLEDDRQRKKLRACEDSHASSSLTAENMGGRTSTTPHRLLGSSLNGKQHAPFLGLAPARETKSVEPNELPLLFPSVDTDDCSDMTPRPVDDDDRQTVLPLLFSLDRKGKREMPPCSEADDDPALTLSLGLPSTSTKPVLKNEGPDLPHINTSLLLFSGFPDT